MLNILVTLDTSQLEMSPLNDFAAVNMRRMLVTLDTSHSEMSPLNVDISGTCHASNKLIILVTAETSQAPIRPCGLLKQSVGVSLTHCTMAALTSALDVGVQPVVGHCVIVVTRFG